MVVVVFCFCYVWFCFVLFYFVSCFVFLSAINGGAMIYIFSQQFADLNTSIPPS